MSAPPPKKLLRLTRSMSRYDFSKSPLAEADIVIDKTGRIAKHRTGTAGGDATKDQLAAADDCPPNR